MMIFSWIIPGMRIRIFFLAEIHILFIENSSYNLLKRLIRYSRSLVSWNSLNLFLTAVLHLYYVILINYLRWISCYSLLL
jgi:hypothetical protein